MKIAELQAYGITSSLIDGLSELGYENLTEVQTLAIQHGLFEQKSMVVSAPTNTGKTFIGELAALRASKRKAFGRAFFLVPLKAIAEEKFEEFNNKYSKWGLNIALTTGDRSEYDQKLLDYDVIIATYEKLNALLVRRPGLLADIGVVVVDELQMIADESRGLVLETLLTKLILSPEGRPQVIGLSATIPNAKEIADWLQAELVETRQREIELREGIIYTGHDPITFMGWQLQEGDFVYKEFNTGKVEVERGLGTDVISGTTEICKAEQCLIFARTRKDAEDTARLVASSLPSTAETNDLINSLDERLESTPSTRRLKTCLEKGVAFHHAGLVPEERAIIEEGFRKGQVRVLFSTSTLGAGVNTPARNAIIPSYRTYRGRKISTRDYMNMSGRAGRLGSEDLFGRSVLIGGTEKEMEMLWQEYVTAQPEKISSQMPALRRMDCIILGLVSSATCLTLDDVISFIKKTFFGHIYYTKCQQDLKEQFDSALTQEIKELATKGFLEEREGAMTITELGRICAQELLLSDTILILHDAMKRSQKTIKAAKNYEEISQGLIHLACCTPDSDLLYPPTSKPEVEELQAIWETRKDKFLAQPDDHNLFLRSLRTSRMLARWIDGVPFSELEAYAPHGVIRRIAETTVWIMNGMLRLADERVLNLPEPFRDFQAILVQRVHYGTPSTALALLRLRIPGIQRIRAMKLAEAGFDSIDSLIRASTSDLTSINGINQTLALRIKEGVERFIEDDLSRQKEQQKRVAQELGRDSTWIQQLYEAQGDSFARVCMDILRHGIGLDAVFVGDAAGYDVDGLVTIPDGRIAIECKRKAKGMVSANEAGEVLSKGAQHNPIAYLAIGFPDFTDEAKRNAARAKIALLRAPLLAEILLGFWEAKLSKDEIVAILRSENYVADIAR